MSDQATSEPPENFDAFKRRLIEIEPQLPKRLRQAAAFALEHPDEFALGTASGSPATPRCRPRPWCVSPRRWASPASPNCRAVSLASAQPLAGLFRAPEGAAAERPGQRRSQPSAVRIRRFRRGLDRPPARQSCRAANSTRRSPSAGRADDPLPGPTAVVLRRPLSDLRALPARDSGLAHRQCGRARA